MIHRRLFKDDGRGVAEALNEVESTGEGISFWTKHVLNIESYDQDGKGEQRAWLHNQRRIERLMNEPLVVAFAAMNHTQEAVQPEMREMGELLERGRRSLENVKVALFP